MKNVNQYWLFQGAVILTIAGLLSKVLSAVYRVPFQNIVGDTGFYIYQQVYPFLGISDHAWHHRVSCHGVQAFE
ncbi:oligosaccharide flippase family protein [Bacillus sp. SL00103]